MFLRLNTHLRRSTLIVSQNIALEENKSATVQVPDEPSHWRRHTTKNVASHERNSDDFGLYKELRHSEKKGPKTGTSICTCDAPFLPCSRCGCRCSCSPPRAVRRRRSCSLACSRSGRCPPGSGLRCESAIVFFYRPYLRRYRLRERTNLQ